MSVTGIAPLRVLYCEGCSPPLLGCVHKEVVDDKYDWTVQLRCPNCYSTWNICTECNSNSRTGRMLTPAQLYQHHHRFHKNNPTKKSKPNYSENCVLTTAAVKPTFLYSGEHNNNYFSNRLNDNNGAAYLVANSQFQLAHISEQMDNDEVAYHIEVASLLCEVTRSQGNKIASIVTKAVELSSRQGSSRRPKWPTQVTFTPCLMRSLYCYGKYALLSNLPRPPIRMIDGHACICLRDCIADLFGHGLPVDCIKSHDSALPVSKITESPAAQRILENCKAMHGDKEVLCLYLTEWSDGFEPSMSCKGNRGSCWIKSITISPPHEMLHALSHTYPIAVGLNGESHEEVERFFSKTLIELKSGINNVFYHAGMRRNVTVYVELLVSLQDQPERRAANSLMLGSSTYTAQWGKALDFAQVAKQVPSCNACNDTLLAGNDQDFCQNCANWDTFVNNGLLDFYPPKHFPHSKVPSSGKLSPLRLTYTALKQAVFDAHNSYVSGQWNANNVHSYLRVHGINNDAVTEILKCAENCKLLTDADMGDTEENIDLMMELEEHPETFVMWKFPSLWERGVELHQHIDVVMHLLFLGIVKTCIQKVLQWTKLRGKHTSFLKYCTGTMESVKTLNLDWCRTFPFKGGKLGGWVSENYLALARLLCWFLSRLEDVASDPTCNIPEDKPQKCWNKRENHSWLSVRGQKCTGTAKELRDRVKLLMTQPGGPPSVLPPLGGSASNAHEMMLALQAMISRIMVSSFTNESIDDCERHIKLFLNSFHKFDKGMNDNNNTPSWITSYNFVCLINIPQVIREFGPVRNMWEGGGQGEKIIKFFKPVWFGFRNNWQSSILDSVLKRMAIKRVINDLNDDEDDIEEETTEINKEDTVHSSRLFHPYVGIDHLISQYSNRQPLSIVRLQDSTFACVVQRKYFVPIRCSDMHEIDAGACYFYWCLVIPSETEALRIYDNESITNYCMLLPKMLSTGMPSSNHDPVYTLVESEWKVLNASKEIIFPNVVNYRI